MTTPRTPQDLARYIESQGIAAELVEPPLPTPTVPLAAQAMRCHEDQIIKSVLFLVRQGTEPSAVLVIINGTDPIDQRKLAALLQVGRKRVKLAPPEDVIVWTGYPAGGVPPFGYVQPIDTLLDRGVLEQSVVYAGGGDDRTLMRTTAPELLQVTRARVCDVR